MFKINLFLKAGFILAAFSLLLFSSLIVSAQATTVSTACKELGSLEDFSNLDANRGRLQREVPELQARIKAIESDIPRINAAKIDLEKVNNDIALLKSKADKTESETSQLSLLEESKTRIESYVNYRTIESFNEELTQAKLDLPVRNEQLRCVNEAISKFDATPEQSFKKTMSIMFAVLIGAVIIGFFTMGWIDETVRRAIFSGQAGLQFITLFSIVIAIILFGITGILEDKELAALLGGLSGYILGRYSAPRTGTADEENPNSAFPNPNVVVAGVSIAPVTANLSAANPSQQLTATATDAQNNPVIMNGLNVQWKSSNAQVATVDQNGLVTRVGEGNCSVTAVVNDLNSNNCTVTCS